ncbi:hypothetical protein GCM10009823_03320 [Brevibacterium salitolerans]|uniref:Uncharacterized protein n=1 Tax=Brevibacterium salitolerans TaxID=1403566 RepID=A0ABN2WDK6_9MICO
MGEHAARTSGPPERIRALGPVEMGPVHSGPGEAGWGQEREFLHGAQPIEGRGHVPVIVTLPVARRDPRAHPGTRPGQRRTADGTAGSLGAWTLPD